MTIEEADHVQATRLYHNTAQVHFDAQARQSIDDTFENSDATKGYSVHSYGGGVSAAPFGVRRLSLTYEGQWSGSALVPAWRGQI